MAGASQKPLRVTFAGLPLDDLEMEIHFVKENVVLSGDSCSNEKFMHGIKVLMAKNYIDNLSEETRKGMLEKPAQGQWPTLAPPRHGPQNPGQPGLHGGVRLEGEDLPGGVRAARDAGTLGKGPGRPGRSA